VGGSGSTAASPGGGLIGAMAAGKVSRLGFRFVGGSGGKLRRHCADVEGWERRGIGGGWRRVAT
jgi:hypothetical protein